MMPYTALDTAFCSVIVPNRMVGTHSGVGQFLRLPVKSSTVIGNHHRKPMNENLLILKATSALNAPGANWAERET